MDVFNVVAGLASIAGLVIIAKVWVDVRKIEHSYQRKARLPELTRTIGEHRSALSALLADEAGNAADIRQRLSSIKGSLASLVQIVDPSTGADVIALRQAVDDHLGESLPHRRLYLKFSGWVTPPDVSAPRKTRDLLARIEEQLKHVQKDEKSRAR